MGKISDMVSSYRVATDLQQRMAAVEPLIEEIGPELLRFATSSVRRAIAEEIFQETAVVIGVQLGQYNGNSDETFRSWCFGILRRKIVNYLREKKLEDFEEYSEESMRDAIHAGTNEIAPGVRHDLDYALKMVSAENGDCGEVLWLHHILGWEIKEIAEAQERTYDAVRVQLGRCLDTAEALMQKHP